MEIAVWIASGFLALAFLFAGGVKALQPRERLDASMSWTVDVSRPLPRLIGAAEVLGAVGVILPHLTGILPWLSVVAAFALALVQLLAMVFHLRRGETKAIGANIVLLLIALFTGIGLLVVL
jgi:hypothetical protein